MRDLETCTSMLQVYVHTRHEQRMGFTGPSMFLPYVCTEESQNFHDMHLLLISAFTLNDLCFFLGLAG